MKKQANGRNCFVCGVENPHGLHMIFYGVGPGEVEAKYVIPEHYQGYPGIAHGGVVAAMLDEVAGRAFTREEFPRFMFTARLSIRYRKPVPIGQPLLLKGHAREEKGRVSIAVGEIYDKNGNILAEAEVVLSEIPLDVLSNLVSDPRDWKVYPDEEGAI